MNGLESNLTENFVDGLDIKEIIPFGKNPVKPLVFMSFSDDSKSRLIISWFYVTENVSSKNVLLLKRGCTFRIFIG